LTGRAPVAFELNGPLKGEVLQHRIDHPAHLRRALGNDTVFNHCGCPRLLHFPPAAGLVQPVEREGDIAVVRARDLARSAGFLALHENASEGTIDLWAFRSIVKVSASRCVRGPIRNGRFRYVSLAVLVRMYLP